MNFKLFKGKQSMDPRQDFMKLLNLNQVPKEIEQCTLEFPTPWIKKVKKILLIWLV